MNLLDILGYAGDVLDTPGRLTRTALAGRNPFAAVFDPSKGVSGRDLMQQYGMVGENQDGLDGGDVGGFLAEMLLDPTNLIGGGLLARLMSKSSKAKQANLVRQATINKGGMNAIDQASTRVRQVSPSGTSLPGQVVIPNAAGDGEVVRYLNTKQPFVINKRSRLDAVDKMLGRSRLNLHDHEPWMDTVINEFDRLRDFADEAKTVPNAEVYRSLQEVGMPERHLVESGYDSVIRPSLTELLQRAQGAGIKAGRIAPDFEDYLPFAQILEGGGATVHRRLVPPHQPTPNTTPLLAALLGQNAMARFARSPQQ
jgi:hypothetical protein